MREMKKITNVEKKSTSHSFLSIDCHREMPFDWECQYFPNMKTNFKIGVVYKLNIVPTLNFQIVTYTFDAVIECLR